MMSLLAKVPDVISRRELLLAATALLSAKVMASGAQHNGGGHGKAEQKSISWSEFQTQMTVLATAEVNHNIDQKTLAERGMQYLKQLDIHSAEFIDAVAASYETGNRYWLWQRMIKANNINGGILNIEHDQIVPLHDHPGATGMVRIISGETEVWLFDEVKGGKGKTNKTKGSKSDDTSRQGVTELVRVAHRVLRPGDMALLTPEKGNIHALRAVSQQCSMLDFFIPPYKRSQRSWYEPLTNNWFDKERIVCQKIPQHAYTMA